MSNEIGVKVLNIGNVYLENPQANITNIREYFSAEKIEHLIFNLINVDDILSDLPIARRIDENVCQYTLGVLLDDKLQLYADCVFNVNFNKLDEKFKVYNIKGE
jgi:hypothetical protein